MVRCVGLFLENWMCGGGNDWYFDVDSGAGVLVWFCVLSFLDGVTLG